MPLRAKKKPLGRKAVKRKVMEDERKNKDYAWRLSHPRKMCENCMDWHDCDNTPWDDISGCASNNVNESHNYLLGYTGICKAFFES